MTAESNTSRRSTAIVCVLLALGMILTTLAYWPSLRGGYIFDDYPNIVDNQPVHLQSLDWDSLRSAALASPSNVLIRPLAMLSFGIDWYLGSGSPLQMRAVNLAIHLINGLLLFGLLQSITQAAAARGSRAETYSTHAVTLALCITVAWLLAPINFTAVGYIVQRMESLCQIFVLAGLWGYVAARRRMLAGRSGLAYAVVAIMLGASVGGLVKESAALLPLYALILEWSLFGFATGDGKSDKRLVALYIIVLIIPASIASAWLFMHALPTAAWVNRPFSLHERLLTEPRILLDYVQWTLLPTPNALALYHDQIALSRDVLDPPTTLASLACLLAATCAALFLRRARPLAALGILWFLSAHLLTGTIIPLELAYEHRNYFASIGLYLAVFSFLLPVSGARLALARATACVALLTLLATVTWVRAMDWGNPVSFALSEAEKNPNSPRTAYELGRTYVVLSHYRTDSPLIPKAYAALEHAAAMPGADALPDQGLLLLSARLHRAIPPDVWTRIRNKLASQPLSAQNISALYSLTKCAIDGDCNFAPAEMVPCFLAALKHPPSNIHVLSIYANYAINVLQDSTLAIELARAGVQGAPRDLQQRKNLLLLLETSGQHEEALTVYRQTLGDLPEAARDHAFQKWGSDLLNAPPPSAPAPPMPQSTP